jgi:hypothetical protein
LRIIQVAEALFEINLPRFSGDILPKSDAGIVLAVADRLSSTPFLYFCIHWQFPAQHGKWSKKLPSLLDESA